MDTMETSETKQITSQVHLQDHNNFKVVITWDHASSFLNLRHCVSLLAQLALGEKRN